MTTISSHTDHRVVDSPLGELLLVASSGGIARLAFEDEDRGEVIAAAERAAESSALLHVDPSRTHGIDDLLTSASEQLTEYFAGGRREFTVPVDLWSVHGFTRRTLEYLETTDFGSVTSYGQVAVAIGSPRAARAVGSACATNPVPILVPCHRVLTAAGRVGGYLGGLERKTFLLDLESRVERRDRTAP